MPLGPQFLQLERRIAPPQSFRHLHSRCRCCCCHRIAWGLQQEKMKRKKEFSHLSNIQGPVFCSSDQKKAFLLALFVGPLCALLSFRLPLYPGQGITEGETQKTHCQIVLASSSGFLSHSACYHLLLGILGQLLPTHYPEFLVAFSERVTVESTYSILTRSRTSSVTF